jgi:hypothetical protein
MERKEVVTQSKVACKRMPSVVAKIGRLYEDLTAFKKSISFVTWQSELIRFGIDLD